jgi:hypothetical protein
MKKLISILLFSLLLNQTQAQHTFVEQCIGKWKGVMYMYNYGTLKDSVKVELTVATTKDPNTWTWKTEYLSPKMPMVKDYLLRVKDKEKNTYVTDEGNNLLLDNYLIGNKMYSIFETHDILLTATYELQGKELIFEVTSGKKQPSTHPEVSNYSVSNLQRVVFRKGN